MQAYVTARKNIMLLWKGRMKFAGIESGLGWSRKSSHLSVLTHFCKSSAKCQRKSPIISGERKIFFLRFKGKCIFSYFSKVTMIKKLYYKHSSKESIISWSIKNCTYIKSYSISFNMVFQGVFSHLQIKLDLDYSSKVLPQPKYYYRLHAGLADCLL